jgi:hypothetical protein
MADKIELKRDLIEGLSYVLFPGKVLGPMSQSSLYEKAFIYWRDFWSEFYASNHSGEPFRADEFFRQDLVAALYDGDEVVAVHTYCLFDLSYRPSREHSYFALYNDLDLQNLKRLGLTEVMTMEFMAMNPKWRKSAIGISLAEILVACGVKILQSLHLDASITIARQDYKVPDFAKRVGFKTLRGGLERHNCPCELMYCPNEGLEQSLSADVAHYVDYFWNRRQDLSGRTQTRPVVPLRRIA